MNLRPGVSLNRNGVKPSVGSRSQPFAGGSSYGPDFLKRLQQGAPGRRVCEQQSLPTRCPTANSVEARAQLKRMAPMLDGLRVLIAEDEPMVADEGVVGLFATVNEARALIGGGARHRCRDPRCKSWRWDGDACAGGSSCQRHSVPSLYRRECPRGRAGATS